jgi:hypothetical protein
VLPSRLPTVGEGEGGRTAAAQPIAGPPLDVGLPHDSELDDAIDCLLQGLAAGLDSLL